MHVSVLCMHEWCAGFLGTLHTVTPFTFYSMAGASLGSAQPVALSLDIINKALSWSALQMYSTFTKRPADMQPSRVSPTGEWLWYNQKMWYAGMFPCEDPVSLNQGRFPCFTVSL